MLLTELAESVTAFLNDRRADWAPESVTAKTELDPDKMLLNELGVYITPLVVNYGFDGVQSRGGAITIQRSMRLALIVSRVFTELRPMGSDGVTTWEEAKNLVDCRERAEKVIIQYQTSSLSLLDVDPDPIEELELDHRNFIAMTSFTWQDIECELALGSQIRSTVSSRGTELDQTAAYIRSRLSSAAKPGRR